MLRLINGEDQKVADGPHRRIAQIAQRRGRNRRRFPARRPAFLCRRGHQRKAAASRCLRNVRRLSTCPPDLVQGVIAGGEPRSRKATETTEDDPAIGARDLQARGLGAADVLCGIAASGRTPYVLGAVDEAQSPRRPTIGISCTPDSESARRVKIAITPLPGPEVIAGSTGLKAGTATKLVLNMLSTGAFIRSGYVRGNLMVNVQPKNSKLLDRAQRIIKPPRA